MSGSSVARAGTHDRVQTVIPSNVGIQYRGSSECPTSPAYWVARSSRATTTMQDAATTTGRDDGYATVQSNTPPEDFSFRATRVYSDRISRFSLSPVGAIYSETNLRPFK